MCNRGRRQSPINIEPSKLLFDHNLGALHIDKNAVSYRISISFRVLIVSILGIGLILATVHISCRIA